MVAFLNASADPQIHSDKNELTDLVSFDKLFSVSGLMDLFLESDAGKFEEKYYWKEMKYLKGYIKYLVI